MTRYLFITDASDFPSDEEHEKGVIKTNLVYRVDCTLDPPELKLRDDLSGRVLSENFMDNSQVLGKCCFLFCSLYSTDFFVIRIERICLNIKTVFLF